ncbi:MAG TPA: BMP family ABC transporter substrate-binding protein [Lachnospiraceae bacterium]|nr:BMP family ABC transporter substrate-binding protein [Lachnospiraceae bacterium]
MRDDYEKARKSGEWAYRRAVFRGEYPYLPALNAMVHDIDKYAVRDLGIREVPMDMIVGTRTVGRQNSFALNFMPLMESNTEFASKWSQLYDSACEDGIREAVKVYEFMNKFYVEEGNKRVSVSKYIGYVSILGNVIRILPPKSEDPMTKIYYEYIDFFNVTGLFEITFTKEGSYAKLADLLGLDLITPWPDERLESLRAAYTVFSKRYAAKSGSKLSITTGDAFLLYLEVFGLESLLHSSDNTIDKRILRLWDEYITKMNRDSIDLVKNPDDVGKGSSVKTIFNLNSAFTGKPIRAAFLFDRNGADSSWVYSHELGANEVVENFDGAVEAIKFENCNTAQELSEAFEACSTDEEDIVFATSPAMMEQCLKAAIRYPGLRIMNCSVNLSLHSVPTYYPRMYEAKFLMGCLAASLSENHLIGYRADYPIYGGIANINAFALGAAWFDPYARVKLVWASKKGTDWEKELIESGCDIISGIDMIKPKDPTRKYGLYKILPAGSARKDGKIRKEQEILNLAAPVYQWGEYYEQILKKLIDGSLDARKEGSRNKAVNYWWGMSAGVVDIILSDDLPYASRKAVMSLRRLIINQSVSPFEGEIHTQNGLLKGPDTPSLSDKEIITMDWLCDNVDGEIPAIGDLEESIKETVKVSGVKGGASENSGHSR